MKPNPKRSNTPRKDRTRIGAVAGAVVGLMIVVSVEANSQQIAGRELDQQTLQLIEHYCLTSWRNSRLPEAEWDDSTQQVLLELLETLTPEEIVEAIRSPDSAARRDLNRAIWRICKRVKRQQPLSSLSEVDIPARAESDRFEQLDQHVHLLREVANHELTAPQGDVVEMLLNGRTVAQIAKKLQTSPARISDVKYRAIKKLRELLESNESAA
ncbi:MAG TPA: hypothetical protein PKD64_11970 [Pirellulaceae bacterium]|nr:hypothetical protein [Pirellulaceae bacterium]HMO92902.1 hypothetical protein [Pirellulaceae bacterium]HMP69180.1 hypothetical protein [Pirellulaceae bacterium]